MPEIKKTDHTFPFSGWNIRYQLYGEESDLSSDLASSTPTVVFVHGTPWSSKVFQPIAKAISASYRRRILLYDLAGYGESRSRDPNLPNDMDENGFIGDTSVRAQAKIFSALLGHLKIDGTTPGHHPPAVIAHDIAGTIVLRAHLLHGCEYERLMLLDTNVVLPWGDGFYKLVRSNPKVFLEMPSHVFEAVVRSVIRSACCRSKELGSGWEDVLAAPWLDPTSLNHASPAKGQRNFVRQIAQANDADVAEMLDQSLYEKVRCNVKIMWGEQDEWIPRHKMDRLAEMLGHCLKSFVAIPHAGHLLMIDQPERVTTEIISWLTST